MLRCWESRGPCHRHHAGIELDGRDRRCFYVDGSACRRDRHFGFALGPGVRDGEVFGVNVVRACCFERRDAPFTARCMAGVPGTRPPISSVRWRNWPQAQRTSGLPGRMRSVAVSAANVVVASRTAEVSNERMKGRICGALEMKRVKSSKSSHAMKSTQVRLQWRHHEQKNVARLHNDDRDRCDGMQ